MSPQTAHNNQPLTPAHRESLNNTAKASAASAAHHKKHRVKDHDTFTHNITSKMKNMFHINHKGGGAGEVSGQTDGSGDRKGSTGSANFGHGSGLPGAMKKRFGGK